jgi:dipeptidase
MRTWIGHRLLSSGYESYRKSDVYPLCFAPDRKVSVQDVMEILRNRFEGTQYSPDETGRIDMRVIGTDTALSVHVLQIYPDLPAKMSVITWESLAPAVYGVFVPLSNLCTEVSEPYGADQPDSAGQSFDTAHYAWYALKCLNTIGILEPKVYGEPVADYWKQAEEGMMSAVPAVLKTIAGLLETDPEYAASGMTNYCNYLQQNAFADAQSMLNTDLWFLNFNSNTLKLARNPETNELTGEERVLPPVPITLSPKAYYTVFSMADGADGP